MNKEKLDRRVRQTRRTLREVLLRQLSTKLLRDITVKELCELADINRGTFYLHYTDVYDLFAKVQEEIFREIWEFIQRSGPSGANDRPEKSLPLFLDIFRYLGENRQIVVVLLGLNRDPAFFERLTNIGREQMVAFWKESYGIADRAVVECCYSFVVNGCVGVLKYWYDNGMVESTDELARRTVRFYQGSMDSLRAAVR